MNIVLLVHPNFLASKSMPRFARMIAEGMRTRGHCVDEFTAQPLFYKLPVPLRLRKWLGYIDQFIVFPLQMRWRLRRLPADALFVFSDQALGPWVPLVAKRPHAIHVHDFMALRSALGEFSENPTGWTGRQYQRLIRRGFEQGRVFVSGSEKTRSDLHRFLPKGPDVSTVVHHGLNFPFRRMSQAECATTLSPAGLTLPPSGFLLHVGGNQWYKNRAGVLEIYQAYVTTTSRPLPLWMVGDSPTPLMREMAERMAGKGEVRFLTGLFNEAVCAAYSSARLMLFPSLAEGFGWPIAEAMACGCVVLTTDEAPMTEVGGDVAFYIPRRSNGTAAEWADQAAKRVAAVLDLLSPAALQKLRQAGFSQAAKFDKERTLDAYERIYQQALGAHKSAAKLPNLTRT